ncbi:NAD(P)-dependent oxidoreductase [Candidatus Poribacteria bacterium]|nr:NAD(P)-dependent oxidoreductase [Candidatus Poribacteria bacterium]
MAYLITGGMGCIGCYVIRDLLNAGEKIVVYDFVRDLTIPKLVMSPDQIEQFAFVQGDITDLPHVLRTIKEHKIDRIIHLASWQVPACNANPPQALKVVCEGTINMFEAARIFDLKRVVWASSVAVFGAPEDYNHQQIQNDAPHFPKFIYGACKSLNERYASYYFDTYGVDTIGMRFTAVYGVGRTRGMSSFTTQMIESVALGRPYTVPFSDDAVDWQYVEDVSRSIVMACTCPPTKTRTFNVKGGTRPVKEGVAYLKRLVPNAELTLEPGVFGISWDYDATPIAEEIGFTPAYTMEQGILKTLNRFRELAGLPLLHEA